MNTLNIVRSSILSCVFVVMMYNGPGVTSLSCDLPRKSLYSSEWEEVECRATQSENSGENVEDCTPVCFQNSTRATFYEKSDRKVFWKKSNVTINCCQTKESASVDPNSCKEFVHPATSTGGDESAITWQLGTNLTQIYTHELTLKDADVACTALLIGMQQPFFYKNEIDPRGLKPGQVGRVDVKLDTLSSVLNILLSITNLEKSDEGDYMITISENNQDDFLVKTYSAHVIVSFPPGIAKCNVGTPIIPVTGWYAIRCTASAGSVDNQGNLVCFQNARQLPHIQPVSLVGEQLCAVFWVEPRCQTRCCSTNRTGLSDPRSCKDFVYPPNSVSTNANMATISPSRSTTPTSDARDCERRNGDTLLIVGSISLVISLALCGVNLAFMIWKRRREDQRETDLETQREGDRHGDQNPRALRLLPQGMNAEEMR